MNFAVEACGLTKRYRSQKENRPALDGVDLQIGSGQLFGLIGPDGAGKTTLIRILATVMLPSAGAAQVGGCDVVKQSEAARPKVGYMPQIFSLYPDLTVLENINFFADLNGVANAHRQQRIEELLHFARLTEFTARRAENLSGGMRKKLALACALIHQPEILLLDEPTTGVDPVSRRELWKLLGNVVQQGVTVVVSTPYMDEAERCNQVGILYEGRMLVSGAPAELISSLPYEMLELKARPRRLARQIAGETPGVLEWHAVGDRLRLAVPDAQNTKEQIEKTLKSAKADVSILRKAKASMEDLFIHLSEEHRGQHER